MSLLVWVERFDRKCAHNQRIIGFLQEHRFAYTRPISPLSQTNDVRQVKTEEKNSDFIDLGHELAPFLQGLQQNTWH